MLKLLFLSKKKYIKQISDINNDTNNNLIKKKDEENILENNAMNKPYINENNAKNKNFTLEINKHHSPLTLRAPILLPKIKNNFKKENSQKKFNFSKIKSSAFFGVPPPEIIKKIKKDNTQVSVSDNMNIKTIKNDKKQNNNSNNFQQINNITNINIHIYSNNINKKDDNDNLRNDLKSKFNNISNKTPSSNAINNTINLRHNSYSTINNINNLSAINKSIHNNINNNNNNKVSIFSYKNKTNLKKNNLNLAYSNPFNKINNIKNKGNSKSFFNFHNIINNVDNNKELNTKKFLSNSLPNINLNNKENLLIGENKSNLDLTEDQNFNKSSDNNININQISLIKKDKKNNKSNGKNNKNEDIDNIDTSMNFLRDLTSDTAKFVLFLKLMQTHMDIAILINNSDSSKGTFRKKATIVLSSDVIFKINSLLNNYFNILSVIYNDKVKYLLESNINSNFNKNKNNNQLPNIAIDCFFLHSSLNNIFHKIIKVQMCLHSFILVTLSQLGPYELSNMIKTCFNTILKKTTNSLLNLFEFFIKEDLNLNYPDLIKNNLGQDFYEQINKLTKVKKKAYKNSEILSIILNNINKAYELMKNYTTENLKYSLIKPFGDAVNQMLSSIDKKNLYQFVNVFLKCLLFGELEINKKKIIQNSLNFKSKFNGLKKINKNFNICYGGSSFMNNIQEMPPYLPPKNPKYKYTLVLDMDETLLHFFFTQINGMFFVRPYCFEFLNELNNLYEIITFTAGTKDYADNILNQLDINDNIIKYRLYRQHTTISGLTTYKDLNNLGRDLSKIIIIDNLKDNFKMQPNNGIFIKTWTNDINDCQLKDLLKLLKDIVIFNIDDVRPILQKLNEEMKSNGNMINPYSNINIQKILGHASKIKKNNKEQ